MSIIKTVINRPVTVLISLFLVLTIGGYIILGLGIPIDIYPDFEPPVIIVSTTYDGAGPRDVEDSLTRVLESQLVSVSDLQTITSTSSEGFSQVQLEFEWGLSLDEATNEVRDKLGLVEDLLPEEADSPVIFKFNPSLIPIVYLGVNSERSSEELRTYLEDNVQSQIEQINGVATTTISGGRTKIVRVDVDLNRLNAYNLTLNEVASSIQAQNLELGAGNIVEGNTKFLIRTTGAFSSIQEISQAIISVKTSTSPNANKNNLGNVIRLEDVANVYEGYEDQENSTFAYLNGNPGIYISIQRQSGTNSVEVADKILSAITKINKKLPSDIKLFKLVDTSEIIRSTISSVLSSAWMGILLAMLVLFLFLRNISSTLIIGISIPISLVITLTVMYYLGLTLNVMTLTGLILGIGMIVDASIVVLENIYKYRERGTKLLPSAILGTQEMLTAISASTLTTVCVFLPIILLKNELDFIGILFGELAITITVSLICSLFVAIFIVPVLTSFVFKVEVKAKPQKESSMGNRFIQGYANILRKALKYRKTTILLSYSLFLVSLFAAYFVGFELLPQTDDDNVAIDIDMPPGSSFKNTQDITEQIYSIVEAEIPGYQDLFYSIGGDSPFGEIDTSVGQVVIQLKSFDERPMSSSEIKEIIRPYFTQIPGAEFSFSTSFGPPGGSGSSPIDLLIRSDNLDALIAASYEIQDLIKAYVPDALEPQISQKDGLPELRIEIDRQKAYNLGINVSAIALEIEATIDGITASQYRVDGNEYDIRIQLKPSDRQTVQDLNNIFVKSLQGEKIPISSVASLVKYVGPVSISREDQSRAIHITASVAKGMPVTTVASQITETLDKYFISDNSIQWSFAGDVEDLKIYAILGIVVVVMAILLVFGVMASQFESIKDPFIIVFTIPLILIGVVFFYLVNGFPFSALSAIGVVMLSGIVVNNGIVLVDYTNLLRARGYSLYEACLLAGKDRLRPILMTTLTTILGMIPLAFSTASGTELVRSIGQTVVGGLTVSSFLTLFLVPVLYYNFNHKTDRRLKQRRHLEKSRYNESHS